MKKIFKVGILITLFSGFLPFISLADNKSNSNFTSYLKRLERFRNKAYCYAYYLRSAYLRKRVEHLINKGENYYSARNDIYDSAFLIKKAIEFNTNSFFLWQQYAIVNEQLGDLPKTVIAYRHLINIAPSATLCQKLAVLYEIYNKPELAIKQYEKAIKLTPEDFSLRERIIDIRIQQAFTAERFNDYKLAKNFFSEAIENLKQLINIKQKPRYLLKFGLLSELLGKPFQALETYKQTIKIAPDEIDAYIRAARIYSAFGEANLRAGDIETANSNYFQAAALMLKVVPEKNSDAKLLNFTAYLSALAGKNLDIAEDLVKEALKDDNKNYAYIDTLGWILFKKGNAEQALKKLLEAVNIGGDDPVIMDHLGDVYFKLGETEKAKKMWLKSLQLDKNNISVKKKLDNID